MPSAFRVALTSERTLGTPTRWRQRERGTLDELKGLSKETYISPYDVAMIHVGLDQKDQAFDWLQKAYEERSDWLRYLKVDPRLDPLRSDPRFPDLVRRVGLPQ